MRPWKRPPRYTPHAHLIERTPLQELDRAVSSVCAFGRMRAGVPRHVSHCPTCR